MLPYYGSKSSIVHLYPSPRFGKIIEPFAGGASYSLKYFNRDVLLVDKYEPIIKIWRWLQLCSKGDILKLPRLKEGERLSSYNFDCEEARLLMGFIIAKGVTSPRDKVSPFATSRKNHINFTLKRIANYLERIRHWEIRLGSYEDIPNEPASWFIDPPYKHGGEAYIESNKAIDYPALAKWSQEREGQIIVCENTRADWLPFSPMVKNRGVRKTTTEAIWSNYPHNFAARQASLF